MPETVKAQNILFINKLKYCSLSVYIFHIKAGKPLDKTAQESDQTAKFQSKPPAFIAESNLIKIMNYIYLSPRL